MKYFFTLIFLSFSYLIFSQKTNLPERYWEDQLYASVTYNTLNNQPSNLSKNKFSYGIGFGYIKDIPFNRLGKWALGLGLGYGFDVFNHKMHIDNSENFSPSTNDNKLYLHNLEFPIQLRWRNSDAKKYAFWRIYGGVRLSYNINNTYSSDTKTIKNIKAYNKFQTGLELSVGYNSINFYIYYGLNPLFKDVKINNEQINTRIARLGVIFYIL